MTTEQLSFFWAEPEFQSEEPNAVALTELGNIKETSALTAANCERGFSKFELKQAVLGFLTRLNPSTLAPGVKLKQHKYILGAAAAQIVPKGKFKFNFVRETIIVDIFSDRQECLPECAGFEKLLEKIKILEQEKLEMEENIRAEEPNLKISGDLFSDEDCACYNYRASNKFPYIQLLRRLERTRHNLYKGSRMENIRRANAADFLYLAVPEKLVEKHELAPGWGLIYINAELECSIETEAPPQTEFVCDVARNHLALNIAKAAKECVLFENGIKATSGEQPEFLPAPRRRRKKMVKI